MDIKDIKKRIKELQKKLKIVKDELEKGKIQSEIDELEEELPSTIWGKIKKGLIIAASIAGIILTISQIVLIFL